MKDKNKLVDFLASLVIVGVSLYPLYRDDVAKYRLWIENRLSRRDRDRELLAQVQREISLLEHGAGDGC